MMFGFASYSACVVSSKTIIYPRDLWEQWIFIYIFMNDNYWGAITPHIIAY